MTSIPASHPASATPRHIWLDLLRGLAVLGMLETHCFNVLLNPAYDPTLWRQWLDFVNGLAAPTFLWIAGYLQAVSVRKAIQSGRPVITRKRIQYLAMVFGLGICLQLPWDLWQQGIYGFESWRRLCQVNILQCLAVSLFMVMLLGWMCRRYFDLAVTATMLAIVCFSMASASWKTDIMPLDMWLNRNEGSLFPLFPWLGFCLAGCVFSLRKANWKIGAPTALALAIGGSFIQPVPFNALHPGFFAERLGWVVGIACLCILASRFITAPVVQLLGRESLFVYAVHLMLLHALPLPAGGTLESQFTGLLNVQQASYALAAMVVICMGLAWMNEQRKRWKREADEPVAVS